MTQNGLLENIKDPREMGEKRTALDRERFPSVSGQRGSGNVPLDYISLKIKW